MPYKNIQWIKLEKRLLNDYRFYTMREETQLMYIKLLLLAAETNNKVPKAPSILHTCLRTTLDEGEIKKNLDEIKEHFPKFKETKNFYRFEGFSQKHNWVSPRSSQGVPREVLDKIRIDKKRKEKNRVNPPSFSFESLWTKYPSKVGKRGAEGAFKSSVRTEQDFADINKALNTYINSDRVKAGFVQNGSTWFRNWKDWITSPEVKKGVDISDLEEAYHATK